MTAIICDILIGKKIFNGIQQEHILIHSPSVLVITTYCGKNLINDSFVMLLINKWEQSGNGIHEIIH